MVVVGIKARTVLWHRCCIHFSSKPEPTCWWEPSAMEQVVGVSLLLQRRAFLAQVWNLAGLLEAVPCSNSQEKRCLSSLTWLHLQQ